MYRFKMAPQGDTYHTLNSKRDVVVHLQNLCNNTVVEQVYIFKMIDDIDEMMIWDVSGDRPILVYNSQDDPYLSQDAYDDYVVMQESYT